MESLRGSVVCIAKLLILVSCVLSNPMEEEGVVCLPYGCGCAATLRRVRGASLDMRCIYFGQNKYAAG